MASQSSFADADEIAGSFGRKVLCPYGTLILLSQVRVEYTIRVAGDENATRSNCAV
jgi:hypothetical protein